jgi:TM2 domain-containing membrane protein YozV
MNMDWTGAIGVLIYWGLIIAVIYVVISYVSDLVKTYIDIKKQQSPDIGELHARIESLNESVVRIENKVNKIDEILREVSE